jgi:hypothetical protein
MTMFNLKILDLKTTASGRQKDLLKTAQLMFRKHGQKGVDFVLLRPSVAVKYTKPQWSAVDLSQPVSANNEIPIPNINEVPNRAVADEYGTNRKAVNGNP